MDEVTIKYGGRDIHLQKSSRFIAVKAKPGAPRDMLARMAPLSNSPAAGTAALGGFQVLDLANGPVTEGSADSESTLNVLRAEPTIAAGTHVYQTSDDQVPFVPTGRLYIEFAPGVSQEQGQELLDKYALQIVEARGDSELIVQVTPDSDNPLKVARALQESGAVTIAEPDLATPGAIRAFALPTDSRLIDQWHLRNTGFHRGTSFGFARGADSRVIEAWERAETLGSPNVVVAVIDDGFDLTHPDLSGTWKIVAPKDFTRNSADPSPDVNLEDWHGTACAGVAVGNADGAGIVGAAPRCRLMPIRWSRGLSDQSVEAWFSYARQQGAWVVSCSWGAAAKVFRLSTLMKRAIEKCAREGRDGLGTVICFAAGNSSRDINAPDGSTIDGFAIHPDVIAVAACNSLDKRSSYSNFGNEISVCAPSSGAGGWGITTSDVMGQYQRGNQTFEAGYSQGAYTDEFGGTSSACPLVAGICALLLSIDPTLKAAEVRDIIQRTARRIGNPSSYNANKHSREFGFGCIDATAAVTEILNETAIDEFWGETGHQAVNKLAIPGLSGDLRKFYEEHAESIEQHAMDADKAKSTDPAEGPRHYIDLDDYGIFPFPELPESYKEAVAKFGESVVTKRGILPWQIERTYLLLIESWKRMDREKILRHSAWLGHYVGDAHVPLHTTANHNGQLTGQSGLHSYFETQVVKQFVAPEDIRVDEAEELHKPVNVLAFDWVRRSHTFVKPLLMADKMARKPSGARDLPRFAEIAAPIAVERLGSASTQLACLWLTAWKQAGANDPLKLTQQPAYAAPA